MEINHDEAKQLVGTEAWGTVRAHLIALQRAGIVEKWLNHSTRVWFVEYPAPAWLLADRAKARAGRSDPRDLPTETGTDEAAGNGERAPGDQIRANHQQIRAPDDQIRANYQQTRAKTGDGIGRYQVGRYTNNEDLDSDRYLPTADPQTAPDVAELEPDQRWSFELLTDSDIGMMAANALKCARLHKPAYVVRHVATWWSTRRGRGAGALFNRLLNWKQFPPHEEIDEDFLASDLYRRHYPLDEDDARRWALWQSYGEHADLVQGLSPPDMPPEVEALVRQLPLPKGDGT
ncbi:MAG: hypothetical protein KJZ93_26325 [Caldilineaceae bacterium]|nr:hypothetical protein [Caldilineaceae bacterium]